jgi:hypothetical protein
MDTSETARSAAAGGRIARGLVSMQNVQAWITPTAW